MDEMAQRRSKEAPLSACPVTSESSRISDTFQDYDFAVLSPGLPDDTSIPRYLGVESIAGCPQFAHALDEDLTVDFYSERQGLFDTINYDPLVYLVATNGSLKHTSGIQHSQANIRRSIPPNLNLLRFRATENCSEQLRKRCFGVDIERTLAMMRFTPGVSKTIPASFLDEAGIGAVFLHCLGRKSGTSTDILTEWKLIAYKELLRQLQIYRVDIAVKDRAKMLSEWRHFGYVLENSKMEVWEMKVRIATSNTKQDSPLLQSLSMASSERSSIPVAKETSNATIKAEPASQKLSSKEVNSAPNDKACSTTTTRTRQSVSKSRRRSKDHHPIQSESSDPPTEVISGSDPYVLPCDCRRICIFDLTKATDIKEFYDINNAIMKWGQAKHGMQFMESLHRLFNQDRDWNNEWMMSAEETKEFWKGLVAFECPKPACL